MLHDATRAFRSIHLNVMLRLMCAVLTSGFAPELSAEISEDDSLSFSDPEASIKLQSLSVVTLRSTFVFGILKDTFLHSLIEYVRTCTE